MGFISPAFSTSSESLRVQFYVQFNLLLVDYTQYCTATDELDIVTMYINELVLGQSLLKLVSLS